MATLMIDGQAHSAEKPLKTVGDLVAAADDWLARSGRIVTELRLDGVDEPAFREPQIVGQSASALLRGPDSSPARGRTLPCAACTRPVMP